MIAHIAPGPVLSSNDLGQTSELSIPQLVGEVFESAPAAERRRLLEQLLRPLGALSLVAVADGIFAKLRFRGGWSDFHVRVDDAQDVKESDVIALVDHVQQVSVEAVDGLAEMLASSPVMTGSAAAALLITLLMRRIRERGAVSDKDGSALASLH